MPKERQYNEVSYAVCKRLSKMKTKVKRKCKYPFYNDIYTMTLLDKDKPKDDEIILQVAHTTYHSCNFGDVLSSVNTQYIQLTGYDIVPYNVQQAFLSTLPNGTCNVVNIAINAQSIHRKGDIRADAMLARYRGLVQQNYVAHTLLSSTTTLACNVDDYNRVTVTLGHSCDAYCIQAKLDHIDSAQGLLAYSACANTTQQSLQSFRSLETQRCAPSFLDSQQNASILITTIALPIVTGIAFITSYILKSDSRFASFIRSFCRPQQR